MWSRAPSKTPPPVTTATATVPGLAWHEPEDTQLATSGSGVPRGQGGTSSDLDLALRANELACGSTSEIRLVLPWRRRGPRNTYPKVAVSVRRYAERYMPAPHPRVVRRWPALQYRLILSERPRDNKNVRHVRQYYIEILWTCVKKLLNDYFITITDKIPLKNENVQNRNGRIRHLRIEGVAVQTEAS